jgi:hypothetical protein
LCRASASWANLGLTELRLGELDPPRRRSIGRRNWPPNSEIAFLQGQLETGRGRPDEAIARFRRAVDLNSTGLSNIPRRKSNRRAAQTLTRAAELLDQLVRLSPDNVAAVPERARVAAKPSDVDAQESIASLETSGRLAVEQYRALQRAAAASDFPEAARSVAVLRNVLLRVPAFREDLLAIRTPAELIADPFDRFLSLPGSTSRPSPPDLALTFSPESVPGATPSNAVLSFSSNGTDRPAIFAADAREVRRPRHPRSAAISRRQSRAAPSANSMLAIDWNRDFRLDLVLAGPGGVRLFLRRAMAHFAMRRLRLQEPLKR